MSVTVKHPFVSAVPDSADTSLVRPSNWNADHTIIGLGTAAEKDVGVANGVASLDSGGKVPVSELPAAVLGALSYQGTWNASTNTPALASGVGTKGYYYVVSVAGTTNLDGITDWVVGDWAVYNGTAWQKVDNTDAVTSVNGLTGTVVLTTTNVAEGTNEYFTTARARASVSAGTGISYDSGTGVITNTSPSLGGDVVGPASATDNAVARYDTTTGKLIQNSVVIIDDTGSVTGVNSLTAQSLTVNNNSTLGFSNTDTLDVRARITSDLEPNANNAKDIGTSGRNWRDGFFGRTLHTVNLELTGTTSFDGSQGTSGQVLTSAGTGNTPTWTTPTTGTVTSVAASVPSFLSVSGSPITTNGTLAISYSGTALPVANGGTGATTLTGYVKGTGTTAMTASSTIPNTDISGLGTMSTQNANSVAVTGGSINGTSLGATTASSAKVTTLDIASGLTVATNAGTSGQVLTSAGPGVVPTWSNPAAAGVSSISFGTTGLTPSTATAGVVSVAGTLAVANGGTGATTSGAALTSLGAYAASNPSGYTSNTGTVTSVAASAGTGISVTGSPITTSGTLSITNTAPDQTVVLTAGTGISTSGTYPNFTITNTAPSSGGTVTSVTGTAPVASSGGAAPAISLNAAYGDTLNPYASKTANFVLAAPNGSAGVPTFRAVVAADIPTLNQSTTGNAATATTLQTARTINNVSFNGSANITVEPYVEDDEATNATRLLVFVDNTTAGFKRLNEDSSLSYNPSTNILTAGTFSGALSGNATTATTLATARTINGTSFNGSANITTANWGTARTLWGRSVNGSANITAPLLPGAGSVSAPAFSTSGDTNTGMFFPAADTIAFAEGGTEALRITSTGAISVGSSGSATGTSGQVLTSAGSGASPTWTTPAGSNITTKGLYENAAIISANYTIGTGNNAISAGPITINSGVVVTVPSGSVWVIA